MLPSSGSQSSPGLIAPGPPTVVSVCNTTGACRMNRRSRSRLCDGHEPGRLRRRRSPIHAIAGAYTFDQALRAAAHGECAVNLSGGFHHARRDLSHGFCLVNDIAIGLARLRQDGIHRRVLIIDLDLHQGDGNATVFAGDRETYTVSVHEESIFPIPKTRSDLDIGLPAFTGDADYLVAVDEALAHACRHFTPEVIVYVAGSDPYEHDPLGSLQLTKAGLLARDQRVARFARALKCPLVAVPAGGYSGESPSITADTFRTIAEILPRPSAS